MTDLRGRTSPRRLWIATTGVLAACLSVGAVAWACTPTADLHMGPGSGAPGSVVTITGSGFGAGLVELRMDSTQSAPIATATGPSFSVSVTIPETSAGYHVFGAVGYDREGNAVGETSATFEVTGAAPASATPVVKSTPSTPPQRTQAQPGRPGVPARPESGRDNSTPTAQPARPSQQSGSVIPSAATPGADAPITAAQAARGQADSVVDNAAVAVAVAVKTFAYLHSPRPLPALPATRAQRPAAGENANAWLTAPVSTPETPSSGLSTNLAIGAGLLGLGLVSLLGGFLLVEVRRRRAVRRIVRRRP